MPRRLDVVDASRERAATVSYRYFTQASSRRSRRSRSASSTRSSRASRSRLRRRPRSRRRRRIVPPSRLNSLFVDFMQFASPMARHLRSHSCEPATIARAIHAPARILKDAAGVLTDTAVLLEATAKGRRLKNNYTNRGVGTVPYTACRCRLERLRGGGGGKRCGASQD